MPTITPTDALIHAADSLTDAIMGLVPTPTCTTDAVDQLMVIFNQQARKANDAATAQRVLREHAQAERVIKEERQREAPASKTPTSFPTSRCIQVGTQPSRCNQTRMGKATASPSFKLEEPNDIPTLPQGLPQITQDESDDYNAPPAANTRQQRETQTLMQDFMLQCMEIPGYMAPFTARQAASRKYPLQFLCNLAYAVLDDKTGDLLEYRHLMKHPKYKDVWTKSFGTEIR